MSFTTPTKSINKVVLVSNKYGITLVGDSQLVKSTKVFASLASFNFSSTLGFFNMVLSTLPKGAVA